MLDLLLAPLVSALDRFRGNNWPIEGLGAFKKVLLGVTMGYLMDFTGWVLVLAAILCAISFAPGWGSPLGAALGGHKNMSLPYESIWQGPWFGNILREEPIVAMAARGAFAGLIISPLCFWDASVLYMIPLLAVSYSVPTKMTNNWEIYEYIRGGSIGLSCILIKLG